MKYFIVTFLLISLNTSAQVDCENFKESGQIKDQLDLPVFYGQDEMITLREYMEGSWLGVSVNFEKSFLSDAFAELALERIKRVKNYSSFYLCRKKINREIAISIIENKEDPSCSGEREYLLELESKVIKLAVEKVEKFKKHCK